MPNQIARFIGCQTTSPDSVDVKPNQKIPKMPRQIIIFQTCLTKPPDSGVVDTGDKFLTGVIDTSEQLSPVSLSPAVNLLPVVRTRTP
jgi:hypothetical protein